MGKEYEIKVLDIDYKKMVKILKENGAKKVHKPILFQRLVFHYPDPTIRGFIRVRDEGKAVTITTKTYKDSKFPEETEVEITGKFEDGCKLIKSMGIIDKAFHQSYREKWNHKLAHEITFDWIPGLPLYMEIDCISEDKLNKLISLFGIDKTKIRYGAFDATYEEYYGIPKDILNDHTPSLTFKNILKEIKPKKNKDLLKKIYDSYLFNEDGTIKKFY